MNFPNTRLRRLRQNGSIRNLFKETILSANHFILPLFVRSGKNIRTPISSMPGQFQFSIDQIIVETAEAKNLGIPAVILFGIPEKKDEAGSESYSENGIIQNTIQEIKNKFPEMIVIADCCLCEYTDHGHCGILKNNRVDNDLTLEVLSKIALSQAKAGADIIAPSGMMDGMVKTIRKTLDENNFTEKIIMSYSVKYASALYAPFREAAQGAPKFGDRKSYQMDFSNSNEALREAALDLEEGADILMVKPAMMYLDIIAKLKENFNVPIAAYNISGEYAMIKAAAEKGWIDETQAVLELLTSIKRAGADLILTYHAKQIAELLQK